jgi:hypothetical protein
MTEQSEKENHDKVVRHIRDKNQQRFTVLDNLEGEKNFVSNMFPDLIFKDKSGNTLFILEVKRNGGIAQCLQQWRTVSNMPAVLYLIVPEAELSSAKSIAQVVGIPLIRFGSYTIDSNSNEVVVKYE